MNNKKNILFVEYCPDLKAGGAQRVFLNILKSIDSKKYNIYAAYPGAGDGELSAEVPSYVHKFEYDSRSPDSSQNKILAYSLFVFFIPIIFLRWCYIIKRHNIDVVYVHSIISGFHFSLVKCFINYQLIYHEHNMASQRPKTILWRWLFNFVVYRADKIIAISRGVATNLVEFGAKKEKINVIHNGIELFDEVNYSILKEKGMSRLGIDGHGQLLLVGMVGHFRPWKGQMLFVESLERALSAGVDLHYVIIGGVHDQGYYQQVLDYVEKKNIADLVTITGHQENIPELMACLDIVVVPSVPEPFGLVLLEAMMISKPVIAFNIGGPAEIIINNKTGLLVKDIDSESLGSSVAQLVVDKEARMNMGRAGRKLLEQKFTIQNQGKNIENLIDELLEPLT